MYNNPIPFSFFCELVTAISQISPKTISSRRNNSNPNEISSTNNKAVKKLESWIRRLKEENPSLPTGTLVIWFRLFFPEEGVRRRYALKESKFIPFLERYFRARKGRFDHWNSSNLVSSMHVGNASGCLGKEVENYLLSSNFSGTLPVSRTALSIGRVDELLDELASKCSFSDKDLLSRKSSFSGRSVDLILRSLLDPCSASEIAVIIQIILQDLTSILHPPPILSTTLALSKFNTTAYDRIELIDAMWVWDERIRRGYKFKSNLDTVLLELEENNYDAIYWSPTIGIPVQVPKSERPGVPSIATKNLRGLVSVETKYDGERLQIHIDTSRPFGEDIIIFSKSGRNSTQDRYRLLPIIRSSIPLLNQSTSSSNYLRHQKFILEGEMVPYNEAESRIDEFWKLDAVKAGHDPTTVASNSSSPLKPNGNLNSSQDSNMTGHTESFDASAERRNNRKEGGGGRRENDLHLMIVWFDILLVGDESLLDCPYEERRIRLESVVKILPSYSILAERIIINFDDQKSALEQLIARFAHIIVSRSEGLMLKPLQSKYNDFELGQKWVKLKKDFIPGGAGDTLDFYVIGARWCKKRGRILGVGPSVMTTFYIGLQCSTPVPNSSLDHYHILFSVSYGLDRLQLAALNHKISFTSPEIFEPEHVNSNFKTVSTESTKAYFSQDSTFSFSLDHNVITKQDRPTCIFKTPRIFELVGAGFQQPKGSSLYELRWPRIIKVDKESGEPVDLNQLQIQAAKAMRFNSPKSTKELIDQMWEVGNSSSKSIKVTSGGWKSEDEVFKKEVVEWIGKLKRLDKAFGKDQPGLLTTSSIPSVSFINSPSSSNKANQLLPIPSSSGSSTITSISTPSSSSTSSTSTNRRKQEFDEDEGYASATNLTKSIKKIKKSNPLGSVTNFKVVQSSHSSRKIQVVEKSSSETFVDPPPTLAISTTSSTLLPSQIIDLTSNTQPSQQSQKPSTITSSSSILASNVKSLSQHPSSSTCKITISSSSTNLSVESVSSVSLLVASASSSSVSQNQCTNISTTTAVSNLPLSVSISPSWSTTLPIPSIILPTNYSWCYVFPKSSALKQIRPSIPILHPFDNLKFFYDPFHVLQLAGWLNTNQSLSNKDKNNSVEGFLIVLNEESGREIKFGILSKFGVGNNRLSNELNNRKCIKIISLTGWDCSLT